MRLAGSGNQPATAGVPELYPAGGRKSLVVLWPVPCHQITPAGDSEGGSDKNTS